jgi:hypothetical protein
MSQNDLEPEPKEYKNKLNTIVQQFSSVLDDFKKYYVFTNKNPEVDEYQHFYLENKSQLQNFNKDVFLIRNDIEQNIKKLNYIVTRLNAKLSSEKELNKELVKLVDGLKQNDNGSSIMLYDTTYIYYQQYLLNIEMVIGILTLIYLLFVLFKKKSNT